jgi:hypothetical protein
VLVGETTLPNTEQKYVANERDRRLELAIPRALAPFGGQGTISPACSRPSI